MPPPLARCIGQEIRKCLVWRQEADKVAAATPGKTQSPKDWAAIKEERGTPDTLHNHTDTDGDGGSGKKMGEEEKMEVEEEKQGGGCSAEPGSSGLS